jgi:hypothetical protein
MQWGLSRSASGPEGCATGCVLIFCSLSPKSEQTTTSLLAKPARPISLPILLLYTCHVMCVRAGENVRLQNAGHKQTGSYLSLKVSLKTRRLHGKEKAVSDVCRMKQCKAMGLHRGHSQKSHRSTLSHLPRALRLLTQDHFPCVSLLSFGLSVRRNVVQPRDEFCYGEAFWSYWSRSEGTAHVCSSTAVQQYTVRRSH